MTIAKYAVTVAADSTVQIDSSTQNYVPYTLTTYVQNIGNASAMNLECKLRLPSELELMKGEVFDIRLGNLAVGQLKRSVKTVTFLSP